MTEARIGFVDPAPAEIYHGGKWRRVRIRSVEHGEAPGAFVVVLAKPLERETRWRVPHNSLRSDDATLGKVIRDARAKAIGAKVTGVLRSIAQRVEDIIGGNE